MPGHRLPAGHAGFRRGQHPPRLPQGADGLRCGPVRLPAAASLGPERLHAGRRAVLLWRHDRHLRLRDEHPGRHRRARQQTPADVGLSWLLQSGRAAGRRHHQRHHGPGREPVRHGVRHRPGRCAAADDHPAAHPALREPGRGPAVCTATRRSALSGHAVHDGLPGGRLDDGLERSDADREPRHAGGAGRLRLCGLLAHHDLRSPDGRPHRG